MKKQILLMTIILTIFALFIGACGGSPSEPKSEEAGLPPVAAVKAREQLSQELGVPIADITILGQEQAEWTDSCLGLGGIAESCLRETVSGWRVELSVNGETHIAHTDEAGEQIRFETN